MSKIDNLLPLRILLFHLVHNLVVYLKPMLDWIHPLYGSHLNCFSFDLCVSLIVSYDVCISQMTNIWVLVSYILEIVITDQQWKFPIGLIGCLSCPIDFNACKHVRLLLLCIKCNGFFYLCYELMLHLNDIRLSDCDDSFEILNVFVTFRNNSMIEQFIVYHGKPESMEFPTDTSQRMVMCLIYWQHIYDHFMWEISQVLPSRLRAINT